MLFDYLFHVKRCWSRIITLYIYSVLAQRDQEEIKDEEMEIFTKLYDEWKGQKHTNDTTYKAIPKFYFKVNPQNEPYTSTCTPSSSSLINVLQYSDKAEKNASM